MKKLIGPFLLSFNLIFAQGYNITPIDIQKTVFEVNTIIFDFTEIGKWDLLINGTICAETMYGRYSGNGDLGLTQISWDGFEFVNSVMTDIDRDKLDILGYPNAITFRDLRRDNKLAIIYCSFYYKYKLNNMPPNNLKECAKDWKIYYNTRAGIGTPKEFMTRYLKYGPKENLL